MATKVKITKYNQDKYMVGLVDTSDYNRWFSTIGYYKTLSGAKRGAMKKGNGRPIIFDF